MTEEEAKAICERASKHRYDTSKYISLTPDSHSVKVARLIDAAKEVRLAWLCPCTAEDSSVNALIDALAALEET